MNLTKLFETQRILDEKIVKEKGLEGQDLLDKKILALQVELGELAQNWRGFKFWSEDQEPRTEVAYAICRNCGGTGTPLGIPEESGVSCWECDGEGELIKNPLLEEYVDCLHFILSIGLEIEASFKPYPKSKAGDVLNQLRMLYRSINEFDVRHKRIEHRGGYYKEMFQDFLNLGEMLGFTWVQIEQAYYAKNKEKALEESK